MAGHPAESLVASVAERKSPLRMLDNRGSPADGEVAEDDVARVLEEVQARLMMPLNREIIHVIPKDYRLGPSETEKLYWDARSAFGNECAGHQWQYIAHEKYSRSLATAGTSAESFVVEPLASAEAVLSAKQKELGTVLINIGGNMTSIGGF